MKKKKSQNRINRKKNNEVKKIESVGGLDADLRGNIITVVVVLVLLVLFYLLALYITKKNSDEEKKDDDKTEEVSISYDNIPLGRSFSIDDGEYYVIYYDENDEDISSEYSEIISNYNSNPNPDPDHPERLKIYTVNMGNGVNINHTTTEETNKSPQNASELKINGPTLIKFSNHTVSEYFEGKDSINEQLNKQQEEELNE